jgi:hypothetical protein
LVRKFRKERDYDDDRSKRVFSDRKKKQKQAQTAKRMSFFETYGDDSSQEYEDRRK